MPHRRLHGGHVPGRRHHDHVALVAARAELPYRREAVLVRQVVVQEDQVHRPLVQDGERPGGRMGGGDDPEAGHLGDVGGVDPRHPHVVVHHEHVDEDVGHRASSAGSGTTGA